MNGFELNKETLLFLRRAHRLEKNKRFAYRINAIILLGSGWTLEEVKDALLLDEETLRNYVNAYKEGGLKLLLKTHHKGSSTLLLRNEIEILCKELESNIYLTTKAVIEYCEEEFKTNYSQSGMRDLLHRLGYEYKKPKLVPGNPDHEAQGMFARQYEAYMNNKPDNVEVLFVDAVHPQHNTLAAYGWIKKGQKREIKTTSGRARLNLHGAMNAETLEVSIIESETVDDNSTIQLLDLLGRKYTVAEKIFVILDNARYHYSRKVQDFLKDTRIKLVFLPSYSPNLNLIERLWKFFKKKVLYNTYYEKLDDFRCASIKFFKNINYYQDELSSIMSGEFELD